jgi:YetA-like protein
MKNIALLACSLFALFSVLINSAAVAETKGLDLKLEAYQALREGVSGTDFENEHVQIGIPFPEGMMHEIKGRASLAIINKEFQTRVLKKWPDGSIKWAVVDFLSSPGKGRSEEVHLQQGAGLSPGKFLVEEKNRSFWVDTGPMKVEIKRDNFNIFNRVIVNGQEIVTNGSSRGIVLIDGNGNEFLAALSKSTKVAIEENGPVKATLRIDGSHCSERSQLLDYTMRLFFYKGKSRVKVQYTLKNASIKSVQHAFIKSLNLDTKLNLDGKKTVTVSTHKDPKILDLQKGKVVYYQAVSDFPWKADGDEFDSSGPITVDHRDGQKPVYKQEGYRIWQDEKLLLEGKRDEVQDLGYIDMSSPEGKGVTAGIRYMAGNWPKALQADASGKIIVSLWPAENKVGYWIRYGSHNTFEVMYSFHSDKSAAPADEMKRFQYPLIARAPIEWYNKNVEGIYPLYHFVSYNDESKLAGALGLNDYKFGGRKANFKVWRYHYWGHGGFLNQHDFARIALVNSLRDDRSLATAGESYLLAESMINYYADWSVYHSDDYDYSKVQPEPKENNDKAHLAKVVFEWEHQHWYGMPLYYYMTGDERIKEAIIDWGDYIKELANPLSLNQMRVFGTGMFSLAALYEFTGNEEFMQLADMNFDRLLKAKYNPQNPSATIFINWERGYVAAGSGSGWPGVKADLMLGSILYDGMLNYYFYMKNSNPLKKRDYSLLNKISEFMLKEPYFEGTKAGKWAFWIPYTYDLTNKEKSDHGYQLVGQASFWTVFPYTLTGERRWKDRMEKMLKMALFDTDGVWGSYGYIDHPGFQTMAYYLLKIK